jgi:threonine/homoserine/homoserine lactone efflux protein
MLAEAIGAILSSAVGVALSPVPIIAVILMLGTPKARSTGLAFAGGWIAGLLIVSILVLLLTAGASDEDSATAATINWFQVIVGVLFLALAVKEWKSRPKEGETPKLPKWMASIDTFSAGKALLLGAALSGINPKNLALTLTATASISQAGLSGGQSAIAVAVFIIIGSLTVAGPVLFFVLAPKKAAKPLASIKEFMSDHNAVIMMVILLILGAKLLGEGLGAVTGG